MTVTMKVTAKHPPSHQAGCQTTAGQYAELGTPDIPQTQQLLILCLQHGQHNKLVSTSIMHTAMIVTQQYC